MERLIGTYRFEPRGLIDVKGKGPTPTYFLGDLVGPPALTELRADGAGGPAGQR
jgi:hypothetical protein